MPTRAPSISSIHNVFPLVFPKYRKIDTGKAVVQAKKTYYTDISRDISVTIALPGRVRLFPRLFYHEIFI